MKLLYYHQSGQVTTENSTVTYLTSTTSKALDMLLAPAKKNLFHTTIGKRANT